MRHEFCLATFIKKLTVKKLCVWCIWFWLISVCIVKYHYTPNLLTLPKPLTGLITQRFGESCDSTHPREDCIDSDYSAGVISENNLTEEFTVNDYMKDHIFKLRRIIWKHSWSPQLYTQLKQLCKQNSGPNGIWTHDICDTGGVLYNWTICTKQREGSHESARNWRANHVDIQLQVFN